MHKKKIYIYIFIFTYITYTLTHLLVPYINIVLTFNYKVFT